MRILILGAAGMLGRLLARSILADHRFGDRGVAALTLADLNLPEQPEGDLAIHALATDLTDPAILDRLVADRPNMIVHLAAVVSGEAERDFARGYAVNVGGMGALIEAIRAEAARAPYKPRLIFASSLAVFGGPLPAVITDDVPPQPLSSYGTQKAICEMILNDASRRGIVDGIALRLPTVCVRPGLANAAASSFYSAILRDPLAGRRATLPVDDDQRHWFASPEVTVEFLHQAARVDLGHLGARRALNLPGVSASVAEMLAALHRVGGDAALGLIDRVPDPGIAAIVAGWPQAFAPDRAIELGFRGDADFDAILAAHLRSTRG